jgi:hypothetical protein
MVTSNSSNAPTETAGNTAVVGHGDHDRVQMLSLNADGTPDQTEHVEMIGDPDASKEATREQFRQQAVASVDVVKRRELGLAGTDDVVPGGSPDKAIDALRKEHEKAEKAAEKVADKVVDKLTPSA